MENTNTPPEGAPAPPTPPPAPYAPYVAPSFQPMLESEARNMSMLIHVLAGVAALISAGTLGIAVPLIMWILYKDRSALVDHHGKENLNLQITVIVALIVGTVLGFVTFGLGFIVTLPLMIAYWLYSVVISFVAGAAAARGEYYRIPMIIRFVN